MDKVIDFIGKAVVSIGGAGVILIAVSTYISKLWADLFMKKKVMEYDKQIEYYKNNLEMTKERYNALNEQIVYKNQKIFDTEFEIYKELTPKLINSTDEVIKVVMDNYHDEEYMEKLHNSAKDKCRDLHGTILKYACFMDKEIFEKYSDFYFLCMNSMAEMRQGDFDENEQLAMVIHVTTEIQNNSNELLENTREYLRNIATIK